MTIITEKDDITDLLELARGTRDSNKRHRLGLTVIILQDGRRFVIDVKECAGAAELV